MPGVPKYVPLKGENFVTGKVPGQPGYEPMDPMEALRFDSEGNPRTPQPKYMSKAELEAQKAELEARIKTSPYGPPIDNSFLSDEKDKERKPQPKSGGGGSGGIPSDKMDKMKKMNYKAGGKVSSASKRADGCAIRGKTRA
jgi:hypothetical protein